MFVRRRLILLACALPACAIVPATAAQAATGGAPSLGARQVLSLGSGVTDPRSLASTDFDGDGRADLVAGSANGGTGMVSVLRGTGGGAFAAPLGNPYGLGGASGGVGAIAAGDINGDGRPDVLATIGSGTVSNNEVIPLSGDGTGVLSAGAGLSVPGEQLAGIALGDLDGDGDLDALTASTTAVEAEQLGIVEQTPTGLSSHGSAGATGTSLAQAVAVGDLTGDGRPDALVASANAGAGSAWVATSSGLNLTPSTPVAVGTDPVAAALADVDEDGDLDALVLDGATNVLSVLRNDGAGALTATSVLIDGLAAGTGIAAGDVNGDGHVDAVVTDGATGLAGALSGDGAGGFGSPTWGTAGAGARSPVVADLDGDGLLDVATADASGDTVSLLRNTGTPAPAGTLSAAFAPAAVGSTGPARTVTVTNPTGSTRLKVTGVQTAGAASDDFLITGDTCTGATVASGGDESCTVRVRFSPSAVGTRTATLRLRYAGSGTYDVPLSAVATAAATSDDDDTGTATTTTTTTTTTTSTTATTPVATPEIAAPKAVTQTPQATVSTTSKLILTLSLSKVTARPGAKVKVGLALGRAAKLVLRVKHAGRTVDVLRVSAREGRSTVTWDGKLGKKAAPKGTYRLDVYAVAADGRAARKSVTLTLKP
ncbi:FG-GAP-like repeat-containing protein [Baekduia sp. Peel2402]|uniref:FG-GAP-like repeat-containing protein n=1 Tax=Baekduia sp. Peel2402 TaxID=3458296 RepID=UPI00403E4D41